MVTNMSTGSLRRESITAQAIAHAVAATRVVCSIWEEARKIGRAEPTTEPTTEPATEPATEQTGAQKNVTVGEMLFETPTADGKAVAPARVEQSPVSYAFFHPSNVEALHTSIRYRVHVETGKVIDRQGNNQVLHVMHAVYQDGAHYMRGTIQDVVRALNERVVVRASREIIGAIRSHQHYLNDIARPVPLPLPRSPFSDETTGMKTSGSMSDREREDVTRVRRAGGH